MESKKVIMFILGLILLLAVVITSWIFTTPFLKEAFLVHWLNFGAIIVYSLLSIIGFEFIRLSLKDSISK